MTEQPVFLPGLETIQLGGAVLGWQMHQPASHPQDKSEAADCKLVTFAIPLKLLSLEVTWKWKTPVWYS